MVDSSKDLTDKSSTATSKDSSTRRSLSVTRMSSGQLQMLDLAASKFSKGKAQIEERFDSKSGGKTVKKSGNLIAKKFSDSLVLTDPITISKTNDKLNSKPQKSKQMQSALIDPVSTSKVTSKRLRNRD